MHFLRAGLLLAAGLPALLWPGTAWSQANRSVVTHGKQATALVLVPSADASGTAFCVDASGYFVTNAHVADDAHGQVTLLIHPGEPGQKRFGAHVLRVDKDLDLALLKADGVSGLPTLPLGRDDGLVETDPVTAYGYPFGTDLSLSDTDFPSVSVSVGHITALRRDKDGLQFIQLDASLNPGNSGGPVLDAGGRVIGVVEAGVPGAALNFAIPVHLLTRFLSAPQITFAPPTLTVAASVQPQVFHIGVVPLLRGTAPLSVALTLGTPGGTARTFTATPQGAGSYQVTAVPRLPPVGPKRLLLRVMTPDGPLIFHVQDRDIRVGGTVMRLSRVRRIMQGAAVTVTPEDGPPVTGPVTGMEAVPAVLGGVEQTISLSRYPSVQVQDADPPAATLPYRVVVREGGRVVGEQVGEILLADRTPTRDLSVAAGLLPLLPTDAPGLTHAGTPGSPVLNPANGHWYQAVSVPGGLGWRDANQRASAMVYRGRRGHLATLTTPEEAQWVVDHFPEAVGGPYWLGGYQDHAAPDYREPDGGWRWVTGEPWSYTRWHRGLYQEPNDAYAGHEDYLEFAGGGDWNDARESGTDLANVVPGFLVEYE